MRGWGYFLAARPGGGRLRFGGWRLPVRSHSWRLESSDPAMGMSTRGGGWRVCHTGAPTTSAPVDHAVPGPAGGGRCVRHATAATGPAWASGQGWRRRSWGGWSSQASNAAARQRVRRPSPRPRGRHGQRVAPVVPPAGAEVVPGSTVDRGDGAERRVGGHGPDCGGSP